MSTASGKSGSISLEIYGLLFGENRSHGLECNPEIYILTIADATLYATAMIGDGGDSAIFVAENVVLSLAAHSGAIKSVAILKALNGIDTEHG